MALTPQKDFREPILLAIGQMGGSAPKPDVLRRVEELLTTPLTEDDERVLRSRDEATWRNRASWERNAMKDHGLLKADTPGLWTLTEQGWAEFRRLAAPHP
jgi:restriction endonuclease Mrr